MGITVQSDNGEHNITIEPRPAHQISIAKAGVQGGRGLQGDIGPSGLSAYQVAVLQGFAGTEDEWLESLVGAEGPEGPAGGVPLDRELTAGDGLSGGGDLSVDRTISLSPSSIASLLLASTALQPGASIPWADVTGKPSFATVATTGLYSDLAGKPALFSGAYADLTGQPTLGSLAAKSSINDGDWSGADLAVANGGTGASTAAAARTNLGLVVGTDVQAYSQDLTAISALTFAADKLTYSTGAHAFATTTLSAFARTLLDDADAATARTTLGIVSGGAWTQIGADISVSGTAAFNITSIPPTYRSLRIEFQSTRANASGSAPLIYATSDNGVTNKLIFSLTVQGSDDYWTGYVDIFNFASTTGNKFVVAHVGNSAGNLGSPATSRQASIEFPAIAINSIRIDRQGSNFASGTIRILGGN